MKLKLFKILLCLILVFNTSASYAGGGFWCNLKDKLNIKKQLTKVKTKIQTISKNRKARKQKRDRDDKTPYVGTYHTVSACGVFSYNDPFKGGDPTNVVVDKVYPRPEMDVVSLNIKNRRGTISGVANCALNLAKDLGTVGNARMRSFDKGAGVVLMALKANEIVGVMKDECRTKRHVYKKKELIPSYDNFGGLMYGKRRFPGGGYGTWSPDKNDTNIDVQCGKLRGKIMVETYSGAYVCMGYSQKGTDEITVYTQPTGQSKVQRTILRKKAAFHKYPVPSCKSKEWLDTRWTTKLFGHRTK